MFPRAPGRVEQRSERYVKVDNDQSFLLDGLNVQGSLRCDATFCGAYVTAPGPFSTNAAVGWLKNLNLSAQCDGNGVDWESGNTLRISDSVVQGFAQYGIKGGTPNGGFHGTEMDNVYMEAGNCSNPLGNIGEMGVLSFGQAIRIHGADPVSQAVGKLPVFANTGSTLNFYYAVFHDTTTGTASAPFMFGEANTNGSGSITLSWPKVTQETDTITYDILRAQANSLRGWCRLAREVMRWLRVYRNVQAWLARQPSGGGIAELHGQTQTFTPVLTYWPGGMAAFGGSDGICG